MLRKTYPFLGALLGALLVMSGEASSQTQPTAFRNILVNGEALIANTGTATLTGVNTTPTYGADGFAGYANNAGASVVVGRSTANLPTGFSQAFSLNRTAANANLTQACLVQEIETARLLPYAGQNLVLTAYLAVGANFSGAGSVGQVTVTGGTGADQGLAGKLAATWTGQANIIASQSTPALTTAYQRVGAVFNMPATVTELAVEFCWTPVGTAGAADTLFMTGAQLEVQAGNCPAVPVGAAPPAQSAAAVTCASQYEHKPLEIEVLQAGRYFQQMNETNIVLLSCVNTGANVQSCTWQLPVQMRTAPATSITAGGLQMIIDSAAGAAVVTPAGTAAAANNVNLANWTFANTASAAVHTVNLRGSLTTGLLAASARF